MNLECCAGIHARQPLEHFATGRERAIFDFDEKWVSGTTLSYGFYAPYDPYYASAMERAFDEWSEHAAINFQRVNGENVSPADIRIAFAPTDGAWSYIGRGILSVPPNEPTMNIGWSPLADYDMALHEIGHTLGLHHEHQNAGIHWDEAAVIESLSGAPNNWSIATIRSNVLSKITRASVVGNEVFDPNSIMMYTIPAAWIASGPHADQGIHPELGLSPADKYWSKLVYPPLAETDPIKGGEGVWIENELQLMPGEQNRLRFTVDEEAEYEMGTTGDSDTVCVLFGDGVQLEADDDSGTEYNALLKVTLKPDVIYELTTRLYHSVNNGRCTAFARRMGG